MVWVVCNGKWPSKVPEKLWAFTAGTTADYLALHSWSCGQRAVAAFAGAALHCKLACWTADPEWFNASQPHSHRCSLTNWHPSIVGAGEHTLSNTVARTRTRHKMPHISPCTDKNRRNFVHASTCHMTQHKRKILIISFWVKHASTSLQLTFDKTQQSSADGLYLWSFSVMAANAWWLWCNNMHAAAWRRFRLWYTAQQVLATHHNARLTTQAKLTAYQPHKPVLGWSLVAFAAAAQCWI